MPGLGGSHGGTVLRLLTGGVEDEPHTRAQEPLLGPFLQADPAGCLPVELSPTDS